jgi:hypothetical protein
MPWLISFQKPLGITPGVLVNTLIFRFFDRLRLLRRFRFIPRFRLLRRFRFIPRFRLLRRFRLLHVYHLLPFYILRGFTECPLSIHSFSSTFKLILGEMTRIMKIVIANGLPTGERKSKVLINHLIIVG